MKTRRLVLSVVGLGCVGLFFSAVSLAGGGAEKVELCHVPPGNPSDEHTITVSVKASESHLANHEGDHLGACAPTCGIGDDCHDGDECTTDICLDNGFCDNSPVDCDDGNQCTTDTCDPASGCENDDKASGTPCDDGEECTADDRCVVGNSPGDSACTGFVTDCDCFDYLASAAPSPICDEGDACHSTRRCSGIGDGTCQDGSTNTCADVCFRCDPILGCVGGCDSDDDCDDGANEECCGDGCCRTLCGPA